MHSPNERYDFVMFFQVLEHVPDVHAFLKNAVEKLEDGGHLLITVPNHDSKYFREGTSSILDYPPHHMTQWSKSALEAIGSLFNLKALDYYLEPIRVEHLFGLLSARRSKLPGNNMVARIATKVGRVVDRILVPYYVDQVGYGGHTHGMLFRKGGAS